MREIKRRGERKRREREEEDDEERERKGRKRKERKERNERAEKVPPRACCDDSVVMHFGNATSLGPPARTSVTGKVCFCIGTEG